jgi:predicted DNA-binding protein YlxM (UPF0122 family)
VLTAKQAVYMFLYYAEGLIMPEISVLMGVHETTVIRVIRSGLNRIGFLYIGTQVTLTHIEAMDRLVYEKYCESWNDANYPRVPSYAKKCSAAVRRTKCNKIMGGQLLSALLEEKTRGGAGSG